MPRESNQSITNREVLNPIQKPQALQVVARPVNQTAMPAMDADLNGLLEGLKSFNPALEQYTDAANKKKQQEDEQAGTTTGNSIADPRRVINDPVAVPSTVDPAFSPSFINGYNQAIGKNLGNQIKTSMLAEYDKQKGIEGFDVQSFLEGNAERELSGVNDLAIRSHAAKALQEAAFTIREGHRKHELQSLQGNVKSSLTGSLDPVLQPDMPPQQIYERLQKEWMPIAKATGLFTTPELSKMVVDRLSVISDRSGGRPELFDIAYIKDASGIAIADNPELAQKVEDMKRAATARREQAVVERDALANAQARIRMEQNPQNVSDSEIWANFNPKFGIFKTDDEVWAFMKRRDAIKQAGEEMSQTIELIRTGQAWRIEKKEMAEAAFNKLTDPYADGIVKAATSGDPKGAEQASVLMRHIIGIHAQSGRDMANKQVKNLFSGLSAEVPKEGQPPSPKFSAAIEMYRALPPNLRELYAAGDAKQLMSNYLYEVENKVDPGTALSKAYMGISPEAKKLAEERLKSPEMQTKIAGYVAGEPTSFWRNFAAKVLPFDQGLNVFGVDLIHGFYPDNENIMGVTAQVEARKFLEKNPGASDDRLKKHLQEFVTSNFTYEPKSNKLVRIPPGTDPAKAQEAFTFYTEKLQKKYGDDVGVELVYKQNGAYQVLSIRDHHSYGEVTIDQLLKERIVHQTLGQENGEAAQLAALKTLVMTGKATTADLVNNQTLIARGKSTGAWADEVETQAHYIRKREWIAGKPRLFNGTPEANSNEVTKAPPRGTPQDMGTVAKKFFSVGDMTAGLITMGEGVVNRIYNDPAKGRNIGMGYNIDMNAKTLTEDFRRAGIPTESIEGIKAGKVTLTEDQSMRLLKAVIPRYEKIAQEGLEKLHPGQWPKLPLNQKAALTDLAYQVGSVDTFPRALQELVDGKLETAGKAIKVTFRSRETGERVVDSRRNNLRYQMLTNPNGFTGLTEYAAGTSGNK